MASAIHQHPQSQCPQPRAANDAAPPTPPATATGKPPTTLTRGAASAPTIPPRPPQTANTSPLFSDATSDASASDAGDDARAGTESQPIDSRAIAHVTSPPYWQLNDADTNGGALRPHNSHNRTASAESVLPPGAITLRDNEDASSDAGDGAVYGRDRNRACWARSVEVVSYVVVNGSATNIGAFVVWNIRVETLSGSSMNIRKRYSEFDDFRSRLVQTFPGFEAAVPVLPPKSVIAKFRPRFLEKRRAGLQYFLNCILLNPEFSGSPVLKDFLFS